MNLLAAIGPATGSSPLVAYRAWARRANALKLDQSCVLGFALEKYIGLNTRIRGAATA